MKDYRNPLVRKQVSVYLPAAEWRLLHDEAARLRLPMAELFRRCLRPGLDRVRRTPAADATSDPRRAPDPPSRRRGPGRED
jgi:hypothetical protein